MLVEVELGVEGFLADSDRARAPAGNGHDELVDRLVELCGWDHAVDQPPLQRRPRVDELAREQHLHDPFAPDGPGHRNHRG